MKEPFSFEPGRIVQSIQGRDRKGYFVILEQLSSDYVMIADGRKHTLEHRKKKKTRHLHATPIVVNLSAIRSEGGRIQDSDLRRALELNGFAPERSLCEEG